MRQQWSLETHHNMASMLANHDYIDWHCGTSHYWKPDYKVILVMPVFTVMKNSKFSEFGSEMLIAYITLTLLLTVCDCTALLRPGEMPVGEYYIEFLFPQTCIWVFTSSARIIQCIKTCEMTGNTYSRVCDRIINRVHKTDFITLHLSYFFCHIPFFTVKKWEYCCWPTDTLNGVYMWR